MQLVGIAFNAQPIFSMIFKKLETNINKIVEEFLVHIA
jgi:hypothetical protein